MKVFVCVVLLAASALAAPAPEGKRDKRGFLGLGHGLGHSLGHSLDLHDVHDHAHLDLSHGYALGHGYELGHGYGLGHGYELGHGYHDLSLGHSSLSLLDHHAPIIHHSPKIVSINKIVEVPKVVEVKKVVSIPKVVSVPQIVKVSKLVHEPTFSYSSHNSGWW